MKNNLFFKILLLQLVFILVLPACGKKKRRAPGSASGGVNFELGRCMQLTKKKKYEEAVDCLEVFKSRYPDPEKLAQAELMIADSYFVQKEYLLAAETYQQFAKDFPAHPKLDYAYYRSGIAYLNENPKAVDRDQQYLDLAVQNFEMMLKYYPTSEYAEQAKIYYVESVDKLAYRHYYVARFYYKKKEYLSSIGRFAEIAKKYPTSAYGEKSFYYLINAYVKTGQDVMAQSALMSFEMHHPESSLLKSARSKIKTVL